MFQNIVRNGKQLKSLLRFVFSAAVFIASGYSIAKLQIWSQFGLASPIFLVPVAYLFMSRSIDCSEKWLLGGVFGCVYYATVFEFVVSLWGGMYGAYWFLLIAVFSVFHLIECGVLILLLGRCSAFVAWAVFPTVITSSEYLRHLFAKAIEGNGMTFSSIGQCLVDTPLLEQCLDLGGVSILTFIVALTAATLVLVLLPISVRGKVFGVALTTFMFGGAMFYGFARIRQGEYEVAGIAVLAPQIHSEYTQQHILDIQPLLENRRNAAKWLCLVAPEAAIPWTIHDLPGSESQQLLLNTVGTLDCYCVAGVWFADRNQTEWTNAAVVLHGDNLISVVAKENLIPYAEKRVVGEALIQSELAAKSRSVSKRISFPSSQVTGNQQLPIVPFICYDIFFPSTIAKSAALSPNTAIACCIGEGFDYVGEVKQLLRKHSRMRAIEFRRPVIRCSDDGLCGVFDGNGQLQPGEQIGKGNTHIILSRVPSDDRFSFYSVAGDWFPITCSFIVLSLVVHCLLHGHLKTRSDSTSHRYY